MPSNSYSILFCIMIKEIFQTSTENLSYSIVLGQMDSHIENKVASLLNTKHQNIFQTKDVNTF